ncbi:MAG: nitroreductase [Desulforhopalus sp.]|jgi:nitroreductase
MFMGLLRKRRSIRQYKDKSVAQEEIDILVESMLRSPSSRSLNPWHFVVVTGPATISELSRSKPHGASFLKNAPLAIVVCADPTISDVWIEDCSIASLNLHLAATDLGLGSCWIQIRERQFDESLSSEAYVAKTLGLEEGMRVEAIIAIGYPKEEKVGQPDSSLLYERVSYEKFGRKK